MTSGTTTAPTGLAARRPAFVGALVLALVGCGGADDASRRGVDATAPPVRQPASRPPPAPAPPGRSIRFRATDGVPLRGRLVPGSGSRSPGVVLVHESDGDPHQFDAFVPYLHAEGLAALTYRSRPAPGRMDETRNARDIAGAVRELRHRRGVDPGRIAVVGASIGATSAAYLAFSAPGGGVRATVGLSPSTFLDDPPAAGKPRDVLLIADEAEQPSATYLAGDAPGVEVRRAPIDGHGVALLEDARVRAAVLEWLTARLDR